MAAEDLHISYEDRSVTVRGEVRRTYQDGVFLRREYELGHFERKFVIGENIDADAIDAEIRNGILHLHLPKLASAQPRRIEVKVN